jgi:glucose-1-phosphate cytidylyltransferase
MNNLNDMELVIFAGGLGSRLSEYTTTIPKPLVEIGGMPIIWHIMKTYYAYGVKDFKILLGYKGDLIKKFFLDYNVNNQDLSIDFKNNKISFIHNKKNKIEDWNVHLLDTGLNTLTGKRLNLAKNFIKNDTFLLTYGDAVSDINIKNLYKSHLKSHKSITLTAVNTPPRFGKINFNGKKTSFSEKISNNNDLINGGFFVLNKSIFDYIHGNISFENGPLKYLFEKNKVNIYKHKGFWGCMDTLADKEKLENIWKRKRNWNNWN